MQAESFSSLENHLDKEKSLQDFQSAMMNILDDFGAEKKQLTLFQTAMLNILEDSSEDKNQFSQMQTATLNILEDFNEEKKQLQHSQRAFLNILEDIDVEKNKVSDAYQKIELANASLQLSNQALDEFAYAASHDLKAPLRVIDNTSKWLEEDLKAHLTDETRENMLLLRGRVKRMEKLLEDLLEYARIGRTKDEHFSEMIIGDDLIDNILRLLSPPKNFTITVDPYFSKINLYRMPLQQILMNLIGNAIKHHDKKEGHIDVTVKENETHYIFSVKDDGPGIAAQHHEKIFKIFQTLKPRDQVEGSGMGLAMVKKNIEVFGGTIHLKSSEGRGSIFSFTWPKQHNKEKNR